MARVKKTQPTLDSIFFSTPEQKVLRFLLSEPTTSFTARVISSKLKGIRGLGGAEGIASVMDELQEVGLIDFVDNRRAVRLQDDSPFVHILKSFAAICDLESLRALLLPVSSRGILHGSRAIGRGTSESQFELYIVSETPEEVRKTVLRHPLGRQVELILATPEAFGEIEKQNPALARKLEQGIVIWGSNW